jgi:hypothetical protein
MDEPHGLSMYRRGVTFHTGWVNTRPLMHEPLPLIADGTFDPRAVETAIVDFDQAAEALAEPMSAGTAASHERDPPDHLITASLTIAFAAAVSERELVVASGNQRVSRPGRA